MKYLMLALTLLVPVVSHGQHGHATKVMEPASLASGVGDVNHPVSTNKSATDVLYSAWLKA